MQPLNVLAPFLVPGPNGSYTEISSSGLYSSQVTVDNLIFADGSSMKTAGSGLPSDIDLGTF